MHIFKGITTVFANKKWVFAYTVLFIVYKLAMAMVLSGSDVALILAALIPTVLTASSFDKSKWRIPTENKPEIND